MRDEGGRARLGTREDIVRSASKAFDRHGFRKTTTEDIARGCGLTKAALYRYFPSKKALFTSVVREQADYYLEHIRATAREHQEPRAQIEAVIRARFAVFEEVLLLHELSTQVASELLPLAHEALQDFFSAEATLLEEIIERGIQTGVFRARNARLVSIAFLSACRGIEFQFVSVREAPPIQEGVSELLELMLGGLCS